MSDLAQQLQTSTDKQSWQLDPNGRFRSTTKQTLNAGNWVTTQTQTSHFSDDGDSPSWISQTDTPVGGSSTTTLSRYTSSPDGTMLETASTGGGATTVTVGMTSIHGDVTVRFNTSDSSTVVLDSDEYGNPRAGQATQRYGWLGGKQRAADTITGVILMGVRLYSPTLGRFLSTDPLAGGSANSYDYANQDAINLVDLDGRSPTENYGSYANNCQRCSVATLMQYTNWRSTCWRNCKMYTWQCALALGLWALPPAKAAKWGAKLGMSGSKFTTTLRSISLADVFVGGC